MSATITGESLSELIGSGIDVALADVRRPGAFRAGHLPGAVSIPLDELEEEAPRLLARAQIVVVYGTGTDSQASRAAARELESLGYLHVIEYEGGVADWAKSGYPLESGRPAPVSRGSTD